MKLKYKFVLKEMSGKVIGVAVGRDNELFNGMVKLNSTGAFIFDLLNNQDMSEDQIAAALCEKYSVSEAKARETAAQFLEYLRQNELLAE